MTINIERIDRLIASIEAKDIEAIVNGDVYIPSLGKTNTVPQVTNWLNKRIGYLETAKTMTQEQLDTFVDNYYNGMSTEEQTWADKILADEDYLGIPEAIWEECVLFIVYKYITGVDI